MARTKQTKEIKRWVTLPNGERERRSFYGSNLEEAERKWREAEQPVLSTEYAAGTFGWWIVTKWAPLKAHLEARTHSNYQTATNHLLRQLGNVPVRDIDATALVKALSDIAATHKLRERKLANGKTATVDFGPLAASTVNRCRIIALEVLEYASEQEACRKVNPKRVPRRHEELKDVKVYSAQEMQHLLKACEGSIAYGPALLAMFCGLTMNEARALKGEDLSLKGILSVSHHMKLDGERSRKMKTEYRLRELPLPPGLHEGIRRLAFGGGWLCRNTNGELVSDENILRSMYAKMRRAGLRQLTFHQLRHSFSSWLEENGCPPAVRLSLLGQSRRAVQHRYNHPTDDARLEWLGNLWNAAQVPWDDAPIIAETELGTKTPRSGEMNGRSVLSGTDVAVIRERLQTETAYAIAKDYPVSPKAIQKIRDGITWAQAV